MLLSVGSGQSSIHWRTNTLVVIPRPENKAWSISIFPHSGDAEGAYTRGHKVLRDAFLHLVCFGDGWGL